MFTMQILGFMEALKLETMAGRQTGHRIHALIE
jgi:hypothetical protein